MLRYYHGQPWDKSFSHPFSPSHLPTDKSMTRSEMMDRTPATLGNLVHLPNWLLIYNIYRAFGVILWFWFQERCSHQLFASSFRKHSDVQGLCPGTHALLVFWPKIGTASHRVETGTRKAVALATLAIWDTEWFRRFQPPLAKWCQNHPPTLPTSAALIPQDPLDVIVLWAPVVLFMTAWSSACSWGASCGKMVSKRETYTVHVQVDASSREKVFALFMLPRWMGSTKWWSCFLRKKQIQRKRPPGVERLSTVHWQKIYVTPIRGLWGCFRSIC